MLQVLHYTKAHNVPIRRSLRQIVVGDNDYSPPPGASSLQDLAYVFVHWYPFVVFGEGKQRESD